MSAKPENVSFEAVVSEALEKMRNATAAPSSYEVDRCNGQWIVRRASARRTAVTSDGVAELAAANEP